MDVKDWNDGYDCGQRDHSRGKDRYASIDPQCPTSDDYLEGYDAGYDAAQESERSLSGT